jgi:L-alanine-DL-glutamate epimerase-like enolase superfamily enzyme
MKIERVETFVLHVPFPRPVQDSLYVEAKWRVPAVRLYTDDGLIGTGYTGTWSGDEMIKQSIDIYMAPLLIGRDPHDVRRIWDDIYWSRLHWVGRAGVTTMAHAAVDIACWDLMAQAASLPLWRYLGGHKSEAIRAYNTDGGWLNWSVDDLVRDMGQMVEDGWKAVKMKVGGPNPREDYRRVKAVRDALGPEIDLMVDVNQKWDINTARVWGARLQDFDIDWLEEPLHPDDVSGHAALARELTVPIALGENVYSLLAFRDLIVAGAVEIVQADVTRLGGITEWLQVAGLAGAFNLPVIPHAGDMVQVHQHLVASCPNSPMIEYLPWTREIYEEPAKVVKGRIQLPETPGASTTIRQDAVDRYRVDK